MSNHITEIKNQLANYEQVKAQLLSAHEDLDEQTLLDTLEGCTDLREALLAVADEVQDLECLASGLTNRIEILQARRTRFKQTADSLRNVILSAMERAEIKTIKGEIATLSVRNTPAQVEVVEEAEIPARFFAPQPPKLDKKALAAAVKDGEAVPGARLTNGGISLTMRAK